VTLGPNPFAEDLGGIGQWLGHTRNTIRPECLCPEQVRLVPVDLNYPYLATLPAPRGEGKAWQVPLSVPRPGSE
jgi:hypothetical protein